jgi:hypothetical protein
MPAPTAGVVLGSILSFFPEGTTPGDKPKLAQAVAEVLGAACAGFVERVKMAPGVPCAVTPPAMVGTVAGVGTLIGKGLFEHELRDKAGSVARGLNMIPDDDKKFVEALVRLTDLGFDRYVAIAQVLPGTPVAGGVTAAPMSIIAPGGVVKGELESAARSLNPPRPAMPSPPQTSSSWAAARPQMGARPPGAPMMGGHRGAAPPPPPPPQQLKLILPADFAQIVARVVETTLDHMSRMVLVAPGIPVAGQITGAPGDLM